MADVSIKQKREFNDYLKNARKHEAAGSLPGALELYEKCAKIRAGDPKIEKKIIKLRTAISASPLFRKSVSRIGSAPSSASKLPKEISLPVVNVNDNNNSNADNTDGIIDLASSEADCNECTNEKILSDSYENFVTNSNQGDTFPKPEDTNKTSKRKGVNNERDGVDLLHRRVHSSPGSTTLSGFYDTFSNKTSMIPDPNSNTKTNETPDILHDDGTSVVDVNENVSNEIESSDKILGDPFFEDVTHEDMHIENGRENTGDNSTRISKRKSLTVYYDVNDFKSINDIFEEEDPPENQYGSNDDEDIDNDDDESDILSSAFPDGEILCQEDQEGKKSDVEIGDLRIPSNLYEKLYGYQKEGVKWLWKVHNTKPTGGVLCDDMGLGKTIQVSTFLVGLMRGNVIKRALIVVPLSVIHQWKCELKKWAPGVSVEIYHRECDSGTRIFSKRGIWITTYGMVLRRTEQLTNTEIAWDYVILDEGHTIKNYNAQISQRVRLLNSRRRLVMTGTPITNNLRELWCIMDWACQGKLLGDRKSFETEFEDRIIRGSDKNGSDFEKELGNKIAESLRKLIAPHILRREKKDYLEKSLASSQRSADVVQDPGAPEKITVKKNDLVVWIKLTKIQRKVYEMFLRSDEVKELFNSSKSILAAINVLQKICCHPSLLEETTKVTEGLDLSILHENNHIVENSAKIIFLLNLMPKLIEDGHRTLIFSRSTKMLDIIDTCLCDAGIKSTRIDGTFNIEDRKDIIYNFTEDESINCFLLTTQVGAVGLNLIAADRVIIFDPSWSTLDDQAVDRVYRIGQKRNVIIYRLITCGTVEEKMYRRQVFKQSLMRTAMENDSAYRYFTKQELRELFIFRGSEFSITQKQLSVLHKGQRKSYPGLDENIKFIEEQENVAGVSDHDLLFTVKNGDIRIKELECLNEFVDKAVSAVINGTSDHGNKMHSTVDSGNCVDNAINLTSDEEEEEEKPLIRQKDKIKNRKRLICVDDDDEDDEDYIEDDDDNDGIPHPPTKRLKVRRHTINDSISDDDSDHDTEKSLGRVCMEHMKQAAPLEIRCCECYLMSGDKRRYNKLLYEMKKSIRSGSEMGAIQNALEMLSIYDGDPKLHAFVASRGRKMFNILG